MPGPGSYNQTDTLNRFKNGNLSYRFGESKRGELIQKDVAETPGPGNYNERRAFSETRGFTFSSRKENKQNDIPGPGSYNQVDSISRVKYGSQSYRFAGSKREMLTVTEISELPGPGSYDEKRAFSESRGFTIGRRK